MEQQEVRETLNDPLAQELLHSPIPARLAYTGYSRDTCKNRT
jgi:hypothetical protein